MPSKITVTVPCSPGRTAFRVYSAEVHWQDGATLSTTAGMSPLFVNVKVCFRKGDSEENMPKSCMLSANEIRAVYVSALFSALFDVPLHEQAQADSSKPESMTVVVLDRIFIDK